MKIEQRKLNKWKLLKEMGDVFTLSSLAGVSTKTIGKALNQGTCTMHTFQVIKEFYEKREAAIA